MMINSFTYILLIVCSLQFSVLTGELSEYDQVNNLAKKIIKVASASYNGDSGDLKKHENEADPNDRVDVELWNKLNADDIQNMPVITDYSSEIEATSWLKWHTRISKRYRQVGAHLGWNYKTNLTKENQRASSKQSLLTTPFHQKSLPMGKQFNKYMKYSDNEDLKRIFERLSEGTVDHDRERIKKVSKLHGELETIYSTAKVCEPDDDTKCYALSPYLERLMQVEKDYDRLTWAWKGWHDDCGDKIRPVYLSYINLLSKTVKENGYNDLAEQWILDYEMGNDEQFEGIIDQILEDIMPFYNELHAYMRGRLCEIYPDRFDCNGPIPAHLLGNMWAQQWHDRLDDVIPYPDAPLVNITRMLNERNYSIHQMYKTSEEFFTSINLYPMTPKFWSRSLFTKPTDRDVVCHPSASNMGYHNDYRAKICTIINDDYFYTIHHEMGHVEYYMAYEEKQPYIYRDGANSGFHEAIGDTIGMYAISPTHLVKLGFLDEESINSHYEINYLMRIALQKVVFLPFAYVMDKYRFALFRNEIDPEEELNAKWWELRTKYSGIMAPVPRSDPENFDAGAKYHIPTNVPYLRYFIAHILQFQFYRGMCKLKGHTKRLHMCDIYGNKDVGERFKQMLGMGSSKSWSKILESLTGEDKLEPQAMLDYFKPLHKWLKAENRAKGYPIGWM